MESHPEFVYLPMPSLDIPEKLLVIAQSARMLARMAVDAGFAVFAVDCFADADTRVLAREVIKVASLALADVDNAVEALRNSHGLTHVVYGSGFEDYPDTLVFLEKDWVVLANPAAVYRQFQDKQAFFRQLTLSGVPFPETRFTPPEEDGGWLYKPMRGEGGMRIRNYTLDLRIELDGGYWQRFMPGEAMSAVFLAAGGKFNMLGFNRQWTVSLGEGRDYVFAGVCSHAGLSRVHCNEVEDWLAELVSVYPLQGLGSLDFMLSGGCCYLLEINARIPASAQLYGNAVFNWHLHACLGGLDESGAARSPPAACEVVFAGETLVISQSVSWPDWVVDRPESGAIIYQGQPICSIIAAGESPERAMDVLRRRRRIIENILNTGY